MSRGLVNRNKTGGTNPNIPQTAEVGSRGIVNRMKKGGTMKKAQTGLTTKKGRTTMNIDSSGYAIIPSTRNTVPCSFINFLRAFAKTLPLPVTSSSSTASAATRPPYIP